MPQDKIIEEDDLQPRQHWPAQQQDTEHKPVSGHTWVHMANRHIRSMLSSLTSL